MALIISLLSFLSVFRSCNTISLLVMCLLSVFGIGVFRVYRLILMQIFLLFMDSLVAARRSLYLFLPCITSAKRGFFMALDKQQR